MKGAKQASLPLYIRFGEIPKDGKSKVHRGDQVVREEAGVSVWRAIEDCGYFHFLLHSDSKVFLVTGTEMFIEGADREPLLMDCKVIKEITHYYRKNKESDG